MVYVYEEEGAVKYTRGERPRTEKVIELERMVPRPVRPWAEAVLRADFTTGRVWYDLVPVPLTGAEKRRRKQEADEAEAARLAASLLRDTIQRQALPAAEALAYRVFYPVWGEPGAAAFGTQVETGFRLRVVDYDKGTDTLYEAVQTHALSQEWVPGVDTASLYKAVDVEHAGTEADPIPYVPPMEIFNGKYYVQDGVAYRCTRDSGTPLTHNLADLVGLYVEKIES